MNEVFISAEAPVSDEYTIEIGSDMSVFPY
jgi:hypothetical protein